MLVCDGCGRKPDNIQGEYVETTEVCIYQGNDTPKGSGHKAWSVKYDLCGKCRNKALEIFKEGVKACFSNPTES